MIRFLLLLLSIGFLADGARAKERRPQNELESLSRSIGALFGKSQFAAALPLTQKALRQSRAVYGSGDLHYAAALYDVGNALIHLDRDDESEKYFAEAVQILTQLNPKLTFGIDPRERYAQLYATIQANLGKIAAKRKDFESARMPLEQACILFTELREVSSFDRLVACTNLLRTLVASEEFSRADAVAIHVIDLSPPPSAEMVARDPLKLRDICFFLVRKYRQLGFPDRAAGIARAYADKLAAVIKPLGDAPSEDLSPMTRDWSIYPQLEDWYRVAAESFIDAGSGQEAYAASTESLYYFYSRLQRRPDLRWKRNPMRLAPDPEKSAFGRSLEMHLRAAWLAYSTGSKAGSEIRDSAFRAAQWLHTNGAALSLEMMIARTLAGPGAAGKAREWQDMKRMLDRMMSDHTQDSTAEAFAEHFARLGDIGEQMGKLLDEIKQEYPAFYNLIYPADMSIGQIQNVIAPGEIVVVYGMTESDTYAFAIGKDQVEFKKLDLGPQEIADAVAALRCGLDRNSWDNKETAIGCRKLAARTDTPSDPINVAPKVLPFDAGRSFALYQSILGGFEGVSKARSLIIVPDGALASVPFNVLITRQPNVAVPTELEDYRKLSWLGRDMPIMMLPVTASLDALRRLAPRPQGAERYLGVGNPLLEGEPSTYPEDAQAAALARLLQRCTDDAARRQANAERHRGPPMRFSALFRGAHADVAALQKWPALPETAVELCEVGAHFAAREVDILLGNRATEGGLKALSASGQLMSYTILHFATHGALAGEVKGLAEPGLILTPPTATAEADDDGYLSASEIAALRLDASWVILSACNTAASGENSSEALSGLALSFFYAGARALLVSHWAVESGVAVNLITETFDELAQHPEIGRAEALRRAISSLIEHGESWQAHPSAWAPFVMVGEGGSRR
jgi:CHAT domain-containing protein/tetratricopeptide (TPR) repeat protein